MKLNNKGFTIVEVLVTFILVSIVMISLFSTISAFNERRIQESQRARIYEYKNALTKKIQTDFIEKGITNASIKREGSSNSITGITYTVTCLLKDGTERILRVHQRFTRSNLRVDGAEERSDEFYIEYGPPGELIREEFPELGEIVGEYNIVEHTFDDKPKSKKCIDDNGRFGPCIMKKFQINNIIIYISNETDIEASNHILNIYIGFYGYDLGTKYGINIVAPIDYQKSNASPESYFSVGEGEYKVHSVRNS